MAKAIYFDTKNTRIVSTAAKNVSVRFKKLTTKQKKFHAEHPDAKYAEIMSCEITDAPELSLEDYKKERLSILSAMSIDRSEELIPAYRLRNLISGVYDETTDPKSSELLGEIKRVDSALRDEYYRLKSEMDAAESVEDVDGVFNGNKFFNIG
jgi:hypothetical protein